MRFGVAAALFITLGSWVATIWLADRDLNEVRRLMDADQFASALEALSRPPLAWSRESEVAYRRGVCEHAAGNIPGALRAWERVIPGSPWVVPAGIARAGTLVGDLGRFSDAEALLESLSRQSGPERDQVRTTLAELYFWQGRRADVRRLIERYWRSASEPIAGLRDHWRADNSPALLEKIRWEVERAASLAPDDDRVWLAQASLAMQTGRWEDARAWLDRCLERRPDDQAVWRSRLDLARGTANPALAKQVLPHLRVDEFTEDERLTLEAWMAERTGDARAERAALERLIAIVHDSRALERLATLASSSGQAERAREYRSRKARLDPARDRYRALMDESITSAQFVELAKLAEALGRRFEAIGWWTLQKRVRPTDAVAGEALARLAQPADPPSNRGTATLADLFANASQGGRDEPRKTAGAASTPAPRFRDDAAAAGLKFTYENGRSPERQIPETTGGGIALLDFDGDGWLDVYAVQGGVFPPDPSRPNDGDRLFRNRGDGTFEDASERSGIARMSRGYGHGATVGDIDNDGRPDLFVTRWRSYALYRNRGDGTFEDITIRAGLAGDRDWPTSAAFADLDNDGDLDLYVCHYLAWDELHPTLCERKTVASEKERVDPDQKFNYCTPRPFHALPDHLFRNDGGKFTDCTADAGIIDTNGRGLGVVAADVDDDGKVDLFVANDTTANYLWRNLGGMKFAEEGVQSGVACNAEGAFQAGMGTACGDVDGDGRPDLLVTNFYGESTTFFRNLGSGIFADQTAAIGLAAPSRYLLGFGIALFDANNDGRLDLATANGHVNDDRPDYPYDMPALLMLGGESGRLFDATQTAGAPWTTPRVGRGLAVGDLDNDGRVDLLFLAQKSPVALFHNQTAGGHAMSLLLEGVRSNRDGVGAVVTVSAGGHIRRAWRYGGGSFLSASDPRIHIGLDQSKKAETVEIRWPSGQVDRFSDVSADSMYRCREGSKEPTRIGPYSPRGAETK